MVLVGTQGRKRLTGLEPWERRVSKHFTALGPAEQTDRGQGTEVERRERDGQKFLPSRDDFLGREEKAINR